MVGFAIIAKSFDDFFIFFKPEINLARALLDDRDVEIAVEHAE
jgi:hypothetical protein